MPSSSSRSSSGGGMTVPVATYGGRRAVSSSCRSRVGEPVNVALGRSAEPSRSTSARRRPSATRTSARSSGATPTGSPATRSALDGRRFELAGNNGPGDSVTLHGGPGGYSTQVWQPVACARGSALRLSYVDPDGRNGFPGSVRIEVVYAVTRDNALRIDYRASTDVPTVVNLTNHTYFNLAGEGSGDVYDQLLAINAAVVQPVDSSADPRRVRRRGRDAVRLPGDEADRARHPRGRRCRAAISWRSPAATTTTGCSPAPATAWPRWRSIRGAGSRCGPTPTSPGSSSTPRTSWPAMLVGTSGRAYRQGDGFALETQRFPGRPEPHRRSRAGPRSSCGRGRCSRRGRRTSSGWLAPSWRSGSGSRVGGRCRAVRGCGPRVGARRCRACASATPDRGPARDLSVCTTRHPSRDPGGCGVSGCSVVHDGATRPCGARTVASHAASPAGRSSPLPAIRLHGPRAAAHRLYPSRPKKPGSFPKPVPRVSVHAASAPAECLARAQSV